MKYMIGKEGEVLMEASDDSLPSEISPVHVVDILEDILQMDMSDADEAVEIKCIIKECIKSLRQHN